MVFCNYTTECNSNSSNSKCLGITFTTSPSVLLENRQNSNLPSLCKMRLDPVIINQDHLLHFTVTRNKASNNKNN